MRIVLHRGLPYRRFSAAVACAVISACIATAPALAQVDCGNGQSCPSGTVCEPESMCCESDFPVYCTSDQFCWPAGHQCGVGVDCGDGTSCPAGTLCEPDNKCCPTEFPVYCSADQLCWTTGHQCAATPTPTVGTGSSPTPTRTPSSSECPGDCDGDHRVTVTELVKLVRIAFGEEPLTCPSADLNGDGTIQINEVVAAVSHALQGC